ncbi:CFEM domain-containing protein [Mycena venus]|uniref:CFEM domain-containing protein n=1 Tax=Mycena venus TaxID=2733690 RepID=A0A8H6XLC1_9AGAR|nr:CFEM domain-containing protein [Mycena venus]
MRFSAALAVFSLFAATASASYTPLLTPFQRRQVGPACEQNCLANPNLGGCKSGDLPCMCNNNVFVTSTFQCIQAACSGTDLAAAIQLAAETCQSVGVTLPSAAGAEFSATASLTSSGGAAQTSGGASTSAPASNPSSSAPAPSTTPNGALSASANTAFLGLAAIGVIAFAL